MNWRQSRCDGEGKSSVLGVMVGTSVASSSCSQMFHAVLHSRAAGLYSVELMYPKCPKDRNLSQTLLGDSHKPLNPALLIVKSRPPIHFDHQGNKSAPHAIMVGDGGHFLRLNLMSSKAQGVCEDTQEAREVPGKEPGDLVSLPCAT